MIKGQRIRIISGVLRDHYGTITEPDHPDGIGVAVDNCKVFATFSSETLEPVDSAHRRFLDPRSSQQ